MVRMAPKKCNLGQVKKSALEKEKGLMMPASQDRKIKDIRECYWNRIKVSINFKQVAFRSSATLVRPLLAKLLCPKNGIIGIKLKCKQQIKQVALKAADFVKVDKETSAIVANTGNKNVADTFVLLGYNKQKYLALCQIKVEIFQN